MYYRYQNDIIVSRHSNPPKDGNYCISNIYFDLELYTVYVGGVNSEKQLTYYTQKAKPAEQLAQQLINMRQSQQDTDTAALDLDYRLTLIENNVKEGEI